MIYPNPTSRYPFDDMLRLITELKTLAARLAEVRRMLERM